MPQAKDFISVARSQLGYVERSINVTKYGEWYGLNGVPWCAEFVSWCADQAHASEVVGKFSSTIEHAKWFTTQGRFGHEPKVGSVVFFDWGRTGRISDIDHEEIVESIEDDNTLNTIGGNTGDMVKRRKRSTIYVVGYGHPPWDKVDETDELPKTTRLWDEGPRVLRLQRRLNHHFINDNNDISVDGAFGHQTYQAVIRFQEKYHLEPDGVVGPVTWKHLLKGREE